MKKGFKLSDNQKIIKRYRDDYTEVLSGALEFSNFFHKHYPQRDLAFGKVFVNRETIAGKSELLTLFSKSIKQLIFNNLDDIHNYQLPREAGNYN